MIKPAVALALALFVSAVAQNLGDGRQRSARTEKGAEDVIDENCQRQLEHSYFNYSTRLVAEERHTLSRGEVSTLDVEGSRNGGVSISGWDQPDVLVSACKFASAEDESTAQSLLKMLTVSTEGGRIRAVEPEGITDRKTSWSIQFTIFVPRDLPIEASVHNGGLSLRNLNGNVTGRSLNGGISLNESGSYQSLIKLRATNGGISLTDVQGRVTATTTNGGISLTRGSGEVKLESQNGGITVQLPEGGWVGETLEATSQNGGMIVRVPQGFSSGIEAETSAHSRLDCRLPECPQMQVESGREPKRIQLGGPAAVVHLSTRNGVLQIAPPK